MFDKWTRTHIIDLCRKGEDGPRVEGTAPLGGGAGVIRLPAYQSAPLAGVVPTPDFGRANGEPCMTYKSTQSLVWNLDEPARLGTRLLTLGTADDDEDDDDNSAGLIRGAGCLQRPSRNRQDGLGRVVSDVVLMSGESRVPRAEGAEDDHK